MILGTWYWYVIKKYINRSVESYAKGYLSESIEGFPELERFNLAGFGFSGQILQSLGKL